MTESEKKVLAGYQADLYGLFMKRIHEFTFTDKFEARDAIKLQAILQEIIKVKKQSLV